MQGNAALGALDTSNALKKQSIADFVDQKNADKLIFTAGPAALLSENITGLRPCFGRGDADDMGQIDRVANDVGFVLQGRRYVDGRIGDDERRRVPRHVHHIGMADPPLGPEAGSG